MFSVKINFRICDCDCSYKILSQCIEFAKFVEDVANLTFCETISENAMNC